MIRIALCGIGGRMGRTIVALARQAGDLEVVAGIGRAGDEPVDGIPSFAPEHAADAIRAADALIDFSSPAALSAVLEHAADAFAGRAAVIGTTGLDADVEQRLDRLAATAPVLVAANFSIGVNLLLGLVEQAARVLDASDYDAEIVEAHHGRKLDAPSGTALALGRALARGRDVDLDAVRRDGRSGETGVRPTGEVGMHALRGGSVVGDHHVHFLGRRERIELTHRADDRALFADGALVAARWLRARAPGRYTMRDVLALNGEA